MSFSNFTIWLLPIKRKYLTNTGKALAEKWCKLKLMKAANIKFFVDGVVACVFAVTFNDELIWGERDHDAIYIHRIVTHPEFRGYSFVKEIIKWAKDYAAKNNIKFIRMDTWADNEKLLEYYTGCGFDYVGVVTMEKTEGLPKHYEGISLSLFEIVV
ncbi:ribosomal protein S18 acetylase RimI-like enzyme [Flavobacterium sp. W4I14]|nr:ribosomal protein S18 acetylase RimI-like enzyme [Flavobacterium sp. W4I14]